MRLITLSCTVQLSKLISYHLTCITEANIRTETLKPATSQLSNRSEFDLKKCGTTFLVFEYVEVSSSNDEAWTDLLSQLWICCVVA